MEIGAAEIAGLIAVVTISIKVIDKLVDAVIAKTRKANGHGPLTNGAMHDVADGLRSVAQGQAAVASKLDRICELSSDLKASHIRHEEAVERRFDGLHRRLDKVKGDA